MIRLTERDKLLKEILILKAKKKDNKLINSNTRIMSFKVCLKDEKEIRQQALKKGLNVSTFLRKLVLVWKQCYGKKRVRVV